MKNFNPPPPFLQSKRVPDCELSFESLQRWKLELENTIQELQQALQCDAAEAVLLEITRSIEEQTRHIADSPIATAYLRLNKEALPAYFLLPSTAHKTACLELCKEIIHFMKLFPQILTSS